jgi:hypothetical protein
MLPLILLVLVIPAAALPTVIPALGGIIQYVTLPRLVGGVAALWVGARGVFQHRSADMWSPTLSRFYLIFIVAKVISGCWHALLFRQGGGVNQHFQQLVLFVLFCYVVLSCVRTLRDVRMITWVSVLSMSAFSMMSVFRFVGGASRMYAGGIVREAGAAYDPNYYAHQLLLIIPLAAYLIYTTPNPVMRILAGICAAALVVAELTTVSRAGIGVGLPMIMLCTLAVSRSKVKTAVSLGALVLVGALVIAGTGAGRRVARDFVLRMTGTKVVEDIRGAGEAEISTTGRYRLFIAGAKMTFFNPILGVGPGQFVWRCIDYGTTTRSMAHNMYWSVGGELGLPGLFALLGMIGLTLRDLRRIRRRALEVNDFSAYSIASGMFIGLFAFCVAAVFLHAEAEKFFWMTMFLTVAFGRAMRAEHPETEMQRGGAAEASVKHVGRGFVPRQVGASGASGPG